LWNIENTTGIDATSVGKHQERVMGTGRNNFADGIFLFGLHAHDPFATAALGAVGVGAEALNIAAFGIGHDGCFVWNEILFIDLTNPAFDENGFAIITISFG